MTLYGGPTVVTILRVRFSWMENGLFVATIIDLLSRSLELAILEGISLSFSFSFSLPFCRRRRNNETKKFVLLRKLFMFHFFAFEFMTDFFVGSSRNL